MWFDDQSKEATFESQKFAEGRFRNAYKGTWTKPRERRGRKCVVKDTYTWNPTDWDTSVKIQKKAQELAGSFSVSLKPSHPVSFTDVDVLKVVVITRIPQPYRASCEQLLQQVMSSTTYTFELKFPPHIRATVLQTCREIARR